MDDDHSVFDHEHVARRDRTRGNYALDLRFANQPKWAHLWDGQPLAAHDHDAYSPLDLVHDHGLGPHHHHISVVDGSARLLYWLPSAHPVGYENRRFADTGVPEVWVRDVLESLPRGFPDDFI